MKIKISWQKPSAAPSERQFEELSLTGATAFSIENKSTVNTMYLESGQNKTFAVDIPVGEVRTYRIDENQEFDQMIYLHWDGNKYGSALVTMFKKA